MGAPSDATHGLGVEILRPVISDDRRAWLKHAGARYLLMEVTALTACRSRYALDSRCTYMCKNKNTNMRTCMHSFTPMHICTYIYIYMYMYR